MEFLFCTVVGFLIWRAVGTVLQKANELHTQALLAEQERNKKEDE